MIKTMVAHTAEIDETNQAVEEILAQLDLAQNTKKNMLGIVACHYEFVLSGVTRALCKALPFPVVGTTTNGQAIPGQAGNLLLTIMVLCSDDVEFATQITPSLVGAPDEKIAETYRQVSLAHTERPALALAFAAFMMQNSGDEYVSVLANASEDVPVFGTLAVDDTPDFSNCFLIASEDDYRDRMAIVLLYGDVKPKFYTATISKEKILDKTALITKSEGHILMEVNNRPVADYFEDLGLTKASETSYGMTGLPFMLDLGDGTPQISRGLVALTPQRHALCAGAMAEGATLCIGVFEEQDILNTTEKSVEQALTENGDASTLLVYSCISRNLALGADSMAELDLICAHVGEKVPFLAAYSGGEICPSAMRGNKAVNRFHNNTFTACVF